MSGSYHFKMSKSESEDSPAYRIEVDVYASSEMPEVCLDVVDYGSSPTPACLWLTPAAASSLADALTEAVRALGAPVTA